jgi:hypothetical protein
LTIIFFANLSDFFRIDASKARSLTLYGEGGKQVFNIEFLNSQTVKILGTFFGRRGEKIAIADDYQTFYGIQMSRNRFGGTGTVIKLN